MDKSSKLSGPEKDITRQVSRSEQLLGLERKVLHYLARMGLNVEDSEDEIYLFRYGSTVVMVSLFEEEGDTYVRFASTLLKDFVPSEALMRQILRLNNEVLFGAFLLFEDSTISFAATLLGQYLDYDELAKTLKYVAKVSDEFDDILQELAGGKKAADILKEDRG